MMNRRFHESTPLLMQDVPVVVKWYNPTKGFGFVQLSDGTPDAFLHASVVEQSGHSDLPEGTTLICDISEGRKGPQVAAIQRVESLGAASAAPRMDGAVRAAPGITVEGRVKFFNADKGFGFVSPDDGGKDVYISLRTLQRTGVASLEPNQRVRLTARMGQKGPMADRLELL